MGQFVLLFSGSMARSTVILGDMSADGLSMVGCIMAVVMGAGASITQEMVARRPME